MTLRSGPILETAIVVGELADTGFGDWLGNYLSEFRSDAGIADVQLLRTSTDGATAFVAQLSFDSNEALDEFLAGRLARLERDIESQSPDDINLSSRILREDTQQASASDKTCLNCDSPLRGQYCAQCGQRSQSRLISLWELIKDAFGDLFEIDSRLWQTLGPLIIRPGRLTADYLQGKRARFMPPFRTYLVLSLLFFVVAFFDPREDLAILYAEEPVIEDTDGAVAESEEQEDSGEPDEQEDSGAGPKFNVTVGGESVEGSGCQIDDEDIGQVPTWLRSRLTKQRLMHICEQASMDDGRQLLENVRDNIPAALIVLLPLMAFALKVLYPLSRRYYVEHLLFFVHFHAFFFLMLTLQILWVRTITMLGLNEAIAVLPVIATSLYIPIYLFKSMRRVYGQGFLLTLIKYALLLAVYGIGFSFTMVGAIAIAAFSI